MMNPQKGLDPGKAAPPAAAPEGNKATDIEESDLEIAVHMSKQLLLQGGGLQAIQKAVSGTADPAQVISKFLVQLLLKVKDAVAKEGVELSPAIVLGRGGWVEQMLDLIETELKLPPEWSVEILDDIIETFKALAQSPQQGAAPQGVPAPQGQPPQAAAPPGVPAPQPAPVQLPKRGLDNGQS